MRILNNFISGGRDQATTSYYCRLCNFKIKFYHNIFFGMAAYPLGRFFLLSHSVLRHWNVFTLKENLIHAGLASLFLLGSLLMLFLDLLHGFLWLLTLPFWWTHEQL